MTLYEYDKSLQIPGFCGVDEAGRGPLAGPVFAAAVILDLDEEIEGINDSKKLTEKKREALFDVICKKAAAFSIASASEREIDELNILGATFLAMRRAVAGLKLPPKMALVDGNRNPSLGLPTRLLVKGDATSASVAAASILAKVARDRYMVTEGEKYPQYDFKKHKGYPTKEHYAALDQYGPSPIHRMSFLKKYYAQKGDQPLTPGALGEAAAADFLKEKGYEILERNYRSPYGEIDLIAQKDGVLAFCEVKARQTGSMLLPREAVTPKKQERLVRTAESYLLEHPGTLQPRFDVIEIFFPGKEGGPMTVDVIENAFSPTQRKGGADYEPF